MTRPTRAKRGQPESQTVSLTVWEWNHLRGLVGEDLYFWLSGDPRVAKQQRALAKKFKTEGWRP